MKYDLTFSINLNDDEGDSFEDCILLHLGNGTILQFKDMDAYDNFIEQMQNMRAEIRNNLEWN